MHAKGRWNHTAQSIRYSMHCISRRNLIEQAGPRAGGLVVAGCSSQRARSHGLGFRGPEGTAELLWPLLVDPASPVKCLCMGFSHSFLELWWEYSDTVQCRSQRPLKAVHSGPHRACAGAHEHVAPQSDSTKKTEKTCSLNNAEQPQTNAHPSWCSW